MRGIEEVSIFIELIDYCIKTVFCCLVVQLFSCNPSIKTLQRSKFYYLFLQKQAQHPHLIRILLFDVSLTYLSNILSVCL